jgi:hypothetical protein
MDPVMHVMAPFSRHSMRSCLIMYDSEIITFIMDTQNVDNLASGQQQQGQHVGPRLHGGYRVRQYQGKQYIVPDFLAPSTEQALAAIDAREQVNAMNTTYEVS